MQNKTQGRGYTLLEIMIVLAVLAGAVVGVLRLFAVGSVKAAAQREQTSIAALVDAVRGVHASSPSYAGITMSTVEQQARMDQVLRSSGTPVSAFGGTLTLAAATVSAPDDAFSIRISQLSTKACAALVPALAGQTTQVSTTSGGNIQAKSGVVPNGSDIAKACAGVFFQKNQGALTLVYYSPRATGAAARPGPACAASCAPQTQTQMLTCPTGQVGQINQTRQGTCSADACPVPVWSAWTTVSSSCAVAPAPPLPIVPIAPTDPAHSCVPRTETRSIPCPVGQVGNRTQQQAITCDAGGAHLGAWTTTYDTCLAPPLPCQGGVLTGADTCPAGEFGQVSWVKEMTCTGGGMMIGPKVITGSSCATIGTCRPSSRPGPTKTEACPAGQSGQITQQTTEYSTCASATATPIWGPAQITSTSNTCASAACTPSGGGVWSVDVVSMKVGPIGGTPTSAPYDTVAFNPATGVAFMKTAPTTSRFLASGNIVFDMTVGAQTQQFTVACTQANSVLNSASEHITDECQYTGSVALGGITLDITVDAGGLPAQDWVAGQPAGPVAIKATIAQAGGCTAPSVPGPVIDFEVGFWGGYVWNEPKPGWGVCNAPSSYNSWVLFNQDDGDAAITDHYVVTIARKGNTQTVMIPANRMNKNATPSAPQPDGRQYWYQSWAGVFDAATVKALTPDIDWSMPAYTSATTNAGGGITIQPEMCGATIAITACNAAGRCSAPTTQTDGVSVFSSGERDCQASETGSVPPWPATARQCTKAGLPPPPSCPWPNGGTAPSWCSPVSGGWHCDPHAGKPAIDYRCK